VIRVLLVDDHALLREGTRALLREAPDIEVVAEASAGEEALALARRLRPGVILLDIRLKGLGGVDVARALRRDLPAVKVVMLTAYHYEQYVRALIAIGVHGYLLKNASGKELIAAVRAVQRGEQALGAEIVARLAKPRRSDIAATDELTEREREVLALVGQGEGNGEIAHMLGIGTRTVESHVSTIMAKLGARSRTDAVNLAVQRASSRRRNKTRHLWHVPRVPVS